MVFICTVIYFVIQKAVEKKASHIVPTIFVYRLPLLIEYDEYYERQDISSKQPVHIVTLL